jgi:hypothetical protein
MRQSRTTSVSAKNFIIHSPRPKAKPNGHITAIFLVPGGIGMRNGFLAGLPAGSPMPFPSVNRFSVKNGGCGAILVVAHVTGAPLLAV